MDQRATKFKQKYFNDKKYTTPELEAQEKILKNLTTSGNIVESGKNVEEDESKTMNLKDIYNESKDINLEHYEPVNIFCDKTVIDSKPNDVKEILDEKMIHPDSQKHVIPISKMQENVATIIQETEEINVVSLKENCQDNKVVDSDFDILQNDIADQEINKVKTETTFNKVNAVPKEIELPTGNN